MNGPKGKDSGALSWDGEGASEMEESTQDAATVDVGDIHRSIQHSLRDAVGAFAIHGPGASTAASSGGNYRRSSNDGSSGGQLQTYNSSEAGQTSMGPALPPNIDIIAEATLVVQNNSSDDEEDDVDTLGLAWDEEANRGGVVNDSTSVDVSLLTTSVGNNVPPLLPAVVRRSVSTGENDGSRGLSNPTRNSTGEMTSSIENHNSNNTTGENGPITTSSGGPTDAEQPTDEEPVQAQKLDRMSIYACGRYIQFQRWHFLSLALLIVVICIVVPVSVVLTSNNNNDDEKTTTPINWTKEQIQDILFPSISSTDSLDDPNSPQSQALNWMTTPQSDDEGGGSNGASIVTSPDAKSVEWRIIQRYALAVLYYSTNGNEWKNQYGYLDVNKHECDWGGDNMLNNGWKSMDCNDKGEVNLINLCES